MNDRDFVNHCMELLAPLGPPRSRRMFGGDGIYVDDLFLALVFGDVLYLKVDDAHRAQFEAAQCRPFTYGAADGETMTISYYSAPDAAMESPHEMLPWARRALAAAVAARAGKPKLKLAAVKKRGARDHKPA